MAASIVSRSSSTRSMTNLYSLKSCIPITWPQSCVPLIRPNFWNAAKIELRPLNVNGVIVTYKQKRLGHEICNEISFILIYTISFAPKDILTTSVFDSALMVADLTNSGRAISSNWPRMMGYNPGLMREIWQIELSDATVIVFIWIVWLLQEVRYFFHWKELAE